MDHARGLAAVLTCAAEQRCEDAEVLVAEPADAFAVAVRSYVSFMRSDAVGAAAWALAARDLERANPVECLLVEGVLMLAASLDPGLDDSAAAASVVALAADVDPDDRLGAFARYVATEAALAGARLDLAACLAGIGTSPHVLWSGHPYAGVMLASEARVAAFTGQISRALSLVEGVDLDGAPGHLIRATHALAAGNAADVPRMKALIAEVEDADVSARDRLGRGVHLLLAFSEIALGEARSAVEHLLRAGGGAELEYLTIIDRALGFELLVALAVAEDDLESAQAWQQQAESQADHRAAAPVVLRGRARVAMLAGDLPAAESAAEAAVAAARDENRAIELAEGEVVLARVRIAADRVPDATRGLRDAVTTSDSTGHLAVRRAATEALRPARRRLPPISGGGSASLSRREQDIAELVAGGLSNAAIAAALHLSETTVRTHVTRVLTAHGVATRTGLLARLHAVPAEPRRPDDLTPRQSDVVALVASGKGNAEIATDLGISLKSVETHISSIRDRWQASSRFDVASRWWSLQVEGSQA